MTRKIAAVLLAAGKGTRMKSAQPKVLHPLAGAPMISYPLSAVESVGCQPVVLVVGHGARAVASATEDAGVTYVEQREQLGTGHALLCAESALADFDGTLLLLAGDVPLIRPQTLEALLGHHAEKEAVATVLSMTCAEPYGYGRIVREEGRVCRIVEQKDATPQEQQLTEVNTGVYAFSARFVFDALKRLSTDNAQGEYYLTDVLAMAADEGRIVESLLLKDSQEARGINDRAQMAEVAACMRQRINHAHMLGGVTLVDPRQTYLDSTVTIEADTVIHPGVHLRGATRIGRAVTIEPGVVMTDTIVDDGCHIKAGSVLQEAKVGAQSMVGPMAHLRPGTVLAGDNRIGNFVETKKALIGEGSKASHLSYLGDCELGQKVNVGCGTITCNYDGVNKYRTVIEDGAFIGSDSQLVAPVTVGEGALIGAGSTITKDVPAGALALSRAPQKSVDDWATKRRTPQTKKN